MNSTWLSRKVQGVGPNMVDKSKMSCNKPTKSSRPGKGGSTKSSPKSKRGKY